MLFNDQVPESWIGLELAGEQDRIADGLEEGDRLGKQRFGVLRGPNAADFEQLASVYRP
jgi:hypothetical protein